MILNLSLGVTSLLLKLTKLVGETAESISSVSQKSQNNKEATWNNCLQLSIPTNQFTNAVFSIVWEIYGKYHDESMGDLNVHLAIWRMFICTTLQALISIGKEYDENSCESKKKFISSQITGASAIDLQYYSRTENLEKLFGEVKKPNMWIVRNAWSKNTRNYWSENNGIRRLHMEIDKSIVRRSWTDNYGQSQRLLRFNTSSGETKLGRSKLTGTGRTVWRIFPRSTMLEIPEAILKCMKRIQCEQWRIRRTNHLYVDVRWHYVGRKWQYGRLCSECDRSLEVCAQIPSRSLVILGTWTRKDTVHDLFW